jgi:hypothetical protein
MSAEGMNVVCWGVGAMAVVVFGFGAVCAAYSVLWNRDTTRKVLNAEKVCARDNAAFGSEAQQRGPTGGGNGKWKMENGRASEERRGGYDERHELRRVMATAIFTKLEENEITKA